MAITKATASSIAPAAKGDLVVGSATNDAAILAVGATNGHTLQVDSAEATGMKWAAPASGSFVGCSLFQSSGNGTAIPSGTLTTVLFNSEHVDTDGFHSTSSNTGRITIPSGKGGNYLFGFVLRWPSNTSAARDSRVYLNGATIILENTMPAPANDFGLSQTASLIYPLVAGDYIELRATQGSGSSLTTGATGTGTQFFAQFLGA